MGIRPNFKFALCLLCFNLSTTQSKIEQTPKTEESSQEMYSVFQESLQKYFREVRANAASYLQAASDLQEEIIESRKKNVEHVLSLQKATYEKLGGNNNIPSAVIDLAKSYAEQATQTINLQNNLIVTSLKTISNNIEAFNKNSTTFEEINKRLIDYWASIIKQEAK